MRALIAMALVVSATAVFIPTAGSFDRQPIRVSGLYPDSWSQTISNAERQLHLRFPGISNDYCVGAVMIGHEADSSFLAAGVRWWDKLVCGGSLYGQSRLSFILIFDAKGKAATNWTIYRLKGATISELYG